MKLIVKMFSAAKDGKTQGEDSDEDDCYRSPRATFNDYMEDYFSVVEELDKVYFVINDIYSCYDFDRVRVVFFYA